MMMVLKNKVTSVAPHPLFLNERNHNLVLNPFVSLENGSSPDSFDVKVIPGQVTSPSLVSSYNLMNYESSLITDPFCCQSVLKDLQGIERTEAKTRASYKEERKIGSRPPNCEHKCYGCSPCEAVQVPTITGHFSIQYANYFPEGWNCKCGPSFYSP
ncbi:hypothetical protein Dimus_004146 [Dionaea muscipula]